ncbi:unnamed protein product [Discosporangium mesarthrocarpum]
MVGPFSFHVLVQPAILRRFVSSAPILTHNLSHWNFSSPHAWCEQKTIKPGILLPGFRFPHNWKERWTVPDADPEDVTKDIGVAADRMMMGAEDGYIYHLDELRYSVSGKIGHATLIILTKSRWMDMVDFEVRKPADGGAGSVVLAHGYSTGFLPVSIPLAPILNIPLCILPFSDGMVIRKKWMAGIQKHMQTGAILVEGSGGYQL